MDNIEMKIEIKEKLSASLKTISKEKETSRERLSKEVIEGYVDDHKDIWMNKVESKKKKASFIQENKLRIKILEGKLREDKDEILDLIVTYDMYYNFSLIAEYKKSTLEQLSIDILSNFIGDYKEVIEEKGKQKKDKKDEQKQQKILQREKKANKKGNNKQRRKSGITKKITTKTLE